MYPFTSRGDHGINHGDNTNQNPSMNSLSFRTSPSLSSLSIPTFPPPLNYSSSSSCLRAACSSQTHRSSSNPWQRDDEEKSSTVHTKSLSPDREVQQQQQHMSNNSSSGMINVGSSSTSLSMGAVRMKKKARRKVREPRFCFKTLSDVDVLDDGYKWRKYGQKVVKNTQHPRSYYRCTQDNCRVKKRIERLAEDPRMVITTYEGRHAHSPSHDDEEPQTSSQMNFFW
ncbi:putative WRKY transcription factor 13 [Carex littledalei]|uniref:Putative WRKY transcription factor 13 n=1 Tax=Carex littledalei TaxID=544730 RepID=A0A833VKL3_9POAL|nr:putative WRKY transcription factor 13 [Carex littledalei]